MNRTERNALVVENLPLVGYLVSELCAKATHLSRDDLASAGAVALITSADSFKPDLGVPFGAFARRRIIGAFADEMRSNDWATRRPAGVSRRPCPRQETLTAALGRTPTVDEIAAALGVDRETAAAALADAARTVSALDETTAEYLVADTAAGGDPAHRRAADLPAAAVDGAAGEMRLHRRADLLRGPHASRRSPRSSGITHSAVSQQRAEAIRLLRDGLARTTRTTRDAEYVPESRIAPARRNAYLARLAEQAIARHRPEHRASSRAGDCRSRSASTRPIA